MTRPPLRTALFASLLALATTMAACGNPCSEIAETACATAGKDSDECTRLTRLAAHPSAEDRRACKVALNLVESLEKVQ